LNTENSFLEALGDALSGRSSGNSTPKDPIASGEREIGQLQGEKAKALYSLCEKLSLTTRQLNSLVAGTSEEDTIRALGVAISNLDLKIQLTGTLFWIAVGDELPQVLNPGVLAGIRSDWKVVEVDAGDTIGVCPSGGEPKSDTNTFVPVAFESGSPPPEVIRGMINALRQLLPPGECL